MNVLAYHEQTKHHFQRYARSIGYLDWATQPNPFRFWEGAPSVLLPLLKQDPAGGHRDLYERTRNAFWDFNLANVGAFLELSLGLSAWKQIPPDGARWALRMNPSSGNLHPTEAHLILPRLNPPSRLDHMVPSPLPSPKKGEGEEIQAHSLPLPVVGEGRGEGSICHYQPYSHSLERRAVLPSSFIKRLQEHFRSPCFLIALTSIAWREAWKYGERALRYCQHDMGHALAALSYSGNLLGWKVTWLNAAADSEVSRILGFDALTWPSLEEETVEALCVVTPATLKSIPRNLPSDWVEAMSQLSFAGEPARLSTDHVDWDLIRETVPQLQKPATAEQSIRLPLTPLLEGPISQASAASLIRQRRSAVAYDGQTTLSLAAFLSILDRTLPRANHAPFDLELGSARVHLALFVHRVPELPQGLYFFVRNPEHLQDLKRSCTLSFQWKLVPGSPSLYLLKEGDYQDLAAHLSCHQAIAGEGAFSLGMIARFRSEIESTPWMYKHLFWECGQIGQVLYLEAEAQGLRATGIGCYFDDPMHQTLGLQGPTWQSLYHFTIGGPIDDLRLTTWPPYAHLPADRRA